MTGNSCSVLQTSGGLVTKSVGIANGDRFSPIPVPSVSISFGTGTTLY